MRKQDSREVDIEEISDRAKRREQQRYEREIRAGGKRVSSSQ